MNLSLTEMNTDHSPATRVAEDLYCLRQPMVNCYFVGQRGAGDRPWLLVDCGMPWSKHAIRLAAANLFGRESRPAAIVLTHGHFDHVGSVAELAESWDVPVLAHARIRMLVKSRAIEECQPVRVLRKMGGHPVHDDADAVLMALVDKKHEVLRSAESCGWRIVANDLVSPRPRERVLHYWQQFDVSESGLLDVIDESHCGLAV